MSYELYNMFLNVRKADTIQQFYSETIILPIITGSAESFI